MGHLSKPVFAIAFEKSSAINDNFCPLQCCQRSYQLKIPMVGRRSTTLPENYTAILTFQETLGVSPQQLNKYLTSFVFSFTENTLLDLVFDLPIS